MKDRRFWFWHAIVPGLLFIGIAVIFEISRLDVLIAFYHFDFANERWRCYTCWWSNEFLHIGGRVFTGSVWLSIFGCWLASFRYDRFIFLRRASCYSWIAMLCASGCVTVLKQFTNIDCPWGLAMFDGFYPYIRLFEDRPDYLPITECFPSAHASAGFAFLSLYFMLRDYHRRWAYVGLGLGLILGFSYGYAQQARGAHFMSHDIWAGAVCWFTCLLVYKIVFGGRLWTTASIISFKPSLIFIRKL
jgi:membrane-associated PAP2 superfamily phosphatase